MAMDLSHQRYGMLVPIERRPNIGRDSVWLCQCDCGNQVVFKTKELVRAAATSCGCVPSTFQPIDYSTRKPNANVSENPAYKSWVMMRTRCNDLNYTHYAYYGGRGVTYDPRWNSFENFLADMGPRPAGMTLERKDYNGHYTRDNCYWATREEQVDNRSNNIYFTGFGRTLSLKEWAGLAGATRKELYGYMYRHWLWDIEMVLSDLGLSQGVQENMRLAVD